MRVAITGSSGMIGSALTEQLEIAGHDVVRMRRGPYEDETAAWNPAQGWIRPGVLDGVDAVVNLGGANLGVGRWTAARRQLLRSSRIDSTRLLVDHLASLSPPPSVLVSASAVGYYGDRGDEPLTENAEPGDDFLATLCADWEAEALRAHDAGIRTVITRFGIVLSREGGALQRMLLPFRLGVGGRLGSGDQWWSWVTLEDVLGVLMRALQSDMRGPFNTVAPDVVTNQEFTKALGRALSRPTILPAPPFALRLLLDGPADAMLLASQRVLPERLHGEGYEFHEPEIDGALQAALGR